jgi:hypothetical protein
MTENKTKQNNQSVKAFLDAVPEENKRKDCWEIMKMMQDITQKIPKMWGDSIVGFGSYHYRYDSGREGDYFITGFSPRKQNLAIYIMPGFSANYIVGSSHTCGRIPVDVVGCGTVYRTPT